jgi:hypothetical protein
MVAGVPITVYNRECAGHIITVFIDFSATGGAKAETVTITAGLPNFDLTKNHPIISVAYFATENNTIFSDIEDASDLSDSDNGLGGTVDSTGEFAVQSENTFTFWMDNDVNGTFVLTYWAAGSKSV